MFQGTPEEKEIKEKPVKMVSTVCLVHLDRLAVWDQSDCLVKEVQSANQVKWEQEVQMASRVLRDFKELPDRLECRGFLGLLVLRETKEPMVPKERQVQQDHLV